MTARKAMGFRPVASGARGPRVNQPKTIEQWLREYESNQRIARNWAPSFSGQERFGDDR